MITPAQITALLESEADDPILIVTSGTAVVVPAAALGTERYRGAMEVVSRQDLVSRLGTGTPSRDGLEEIAARLDTTVAQLGA
ncbi:MULTISPECIES: hypothetical protein [Streptomyces]|uniref:Prevent-host-death family protein n=1 Tax=Streptomyces lycii TaxID=2654337 RepID=A0ABQ7FDT8_9ACTN|nr:MULTISPECIES: hypothetical protein [Streptomyces]KAF4407221.1 hypothetical protein GCU69_20940 [Streptomyces lycii]PGH47397.1 hypothetical protein CRI70_28770 [Streptomyces sp. Ru87]